ncbi:MAG: DUF736 domain-containing protein [Rhodospirillum sp.]|nr:DUF736 domain-containing protein [Rhodospirillum sp.]
MGLKLDDPSFNAPICANLFDDEESDIFSLIWGRLEGRAPRFCGDRISCGPIDRREPRQPLPAGISCQERL